MVSADSDWESSLTDYLPYSKFHKLNSKLLNSGWFNEFISEHKWSKSEVVYLFWCSRTPQWQLNVGCYNKLGYLLEKMKNTCFLGFYKQIFSFNLELKASAEFFGPNHSILNECRFAFARIIKSLTSLSSSLAYSWGNMYVSSNTLSKLSVL